MPVPLWCQPDITSDYTVRTRKPPTHEDKRSYSQLGYLADNAPETASPRGEVESNRRARQAVRNENEVHQMSPERKRTVKSSRWCNGEDESDWMLANPAKSGRGLNNRWSSQRHGGVGGRGMSVLEVELKVEISRSGRKGPTPGPSGQTARPERPLEKSERSIVTTKVVTRPERRDRA
jgi:hypothetical protein